MCDWNHDSSIAKSEGSISDEMEVHWVGCITHEAYRDFESLTPSDFQAISAQLKTLNCIALPLDHELMRLHYQMYCKKTLWPMFHNVDLLDLCSKLFRSGVCYDLICNNNSLMYLCLDSV